MSPSLQKPFQELRSILESLDRHSQLANNAPDLTPILSKLRQWVELAEQRRERSEVIIASIRDAFIATHNDGTIVEWNDQAVRIFGRSPDQIIGTPIGALLRCPHQFGAQPQSVVAILDQPQRAELTGVRSDGSTFLAEVTVLEPQKIGDGTLCNMFVRDITNRKRAEDALRNSESLYHSLVDRLPINVTRKDRNGKITFVNQPFCDLVGKTRDFLIGKTDYDLFPQELADKYQEDDRYIFSTGKSFHAVEQNRSDSGNHFFEVWKVPVHNMNGDVVESQAVFWDVTEREENRASLARERDLLQTLMDSLRDLIYIKDADGRFVTVNTAFCSFWGCESKHAVVGELPDSFVSPELAKQICEEDQIVLTQGTPLIDREQVVHVSDTQQRTFSIDKIPLRDSEGNIVGLVGIDRDITNRKRNEEALQSARRSADEANRAKSEFLANMSHEIRTPLTGVVGFTDMLIAGVSPEDQRNYLEIVRDSGESLLLLVNDILDLSKIEADQLSLESTRIDLETVLSGAMKPLAVRAHKEDIELCCDIDPSIPTKLIADPVRLRQVVTNLIGNAIKFTEQGEVTLKVFPLKRDSDQILLEFRVEDTGIGIPADKIDHIFEAFAQADSSTTRLYGGTGLGLAISSRIVGAMGGELQCESELGTGTCFYFAVPMPIADTQADQASFPGYRVLVVEPHATTRQIIVRMLQSSSVEVVQAEDVDDAIRILRESSSSGKPFTCVVADAHLDLAAKTDAPAIIEIVTTTGTSKASKKGVVSRLLKPFTKSELIRALKHDASDVAETPSKTTDPPAGRQLNILLAEDGLVNQLLAKSILEADHHKVTAVTTGRAAVDACAEQAFDLVLMDVQMPELDGLDATREIRAQEQSTDRHTPILAMTANAMAEDKKICLEAGMDAYLSKPMRVDEIRGAIRALTDGN